MIYSFKCYGHKNITSKHRNTLEFTKDKEVSLEGDCIVGVNADFELKDIRKFIDRKLSQCKNPNNKKENKIPIKIIIEMDDIEEEVNGFLNTDFNDDREIVVRKSDFISERTLVNGADKGAVDIGRNLKGLMKENEKIKVTVI